VPSEGFVVAFLVMAIAGMAAGDKNSIRSFLKSFEHKLRVNSTTTHDPDYPEIGSVSHPGCSGEVSPGIGTPITQEAN